MSSRSGAYGALCLSVVTLLLLTAMPRSLAGPGKLLEGPATDDLTLAAGLALAVLMSARAASDQSRFVGIRRVA